MNEGNDEKEEDSLSVRKRDKRNSWPLRRWPMPNFPKYLRGKLATLFGGTEHVLFMTYSRVSGCEHPL